MAKDCDEGTRFATRRHANTKRQCLRRRTNPTPSSASQAHDDACLSPEQLQPVERREGFEGTTGDFAGPTRTGRTGARVFERFRDVDLVVSGKDLGQLHRGIVNTAQQWV